MVRFFEILEEKLNVASKEISGKGKEELIELIAQTFEIVRSERFNAGLKSAVKRTMVAGEATESLTLLNLEITFYNTRYEEDSYGGEEAIDNGKTVKDSIEDLIKLPEWIKKVLKVLNEILSIVKTII